MLVRRVQHGRFNSAGLDASHLTEKGRRVVVAPIEGSPAARAGVRSGDVLLEVDGRAVEPGALDETIERMRGHAGSNVHLVLSREGEPEPLQFDLERSEVHVHTVQAEPLPGR